MISVLNYSYDTRYEKNKLVPTDYKPMPGDIVSFHNNIGTSGWKMVSERKDGDWNLQYRTDPKNTTIIGDPLEDCLHFTYFLGWEPLDDYSE